MRYTLIWADNGAVLDPNLVCDSIQDAYAAKKKYQKSIRLNTSPAECATAWAVEWEAERAPVNNGLIYSGFKHFVTAGLSKVEAYKKRLQLEAAYAKNVRMYEYVRYIID